MKEILDHNELYSQYSEYVDEINRKNPELSFAKISKDTFLTLIKGVNINSIQKEKNDEILDNTIIFNVNRHMDCSSGFTFIDGNKTFTCMLKNDGNLFVLADEKVKDGYYEFSYGGFGAPSFKHFNESNYCLKQNIFSFMNLKNDELEILFNKFLREGIQSLYNATSTLSLNDDDRENFKYLDSKEKNESVVVNNNSDVDFQIIDTLLTLKALGGKLSDEQEALIEYYKTNYDNENNFGKSR